MASACRTPPAGGAGAPLWAGAAKVDITGDGQISDPLFAKALVLRTAATAAVIITVDAVAIGEIGPIGDGYLHDVRSRLAAELPLHPGHVVVNASHCHGLVCPDVVERSVQAVRAAWQRLEPVTVGAGTGYEDRIMENRRLRLRDGREADVRRAYALPPDDQVAGVGPIDPEIGLLRLMANDGRTVAVVYTVACHPIQGVPGGGNTADIPGFASRVVEEQLGDGAIALFLQGCAGDVNPVSYKDVDRPPDAAPLGTMLGLSVLRGLQGVRCRPCHDLTVINQVISLPRADLSPRIAALREARLRLLQSLQGTNVSFKTFLNILLKDRLQGSFPAAYAHEYIREDRRGVGYLRALDDRNRAEIEKYISNIHTMEELVRLQTNLALLERHQARRQRAGEESIAAEVVGMKIGEFFLVTFPGEPSVQIGLNIKQRSPHRYTFVAGYTNGYLYYAPTAEQLANAGWAQEDCDCLLAPEWQGRYEAVVAALLARLDAPGTATTEGG